MWGAKVFRRVQISAPLIGFFIAIFVAFQNFGACSYDQSVQFGGKGSTSQSVSGDGEPFDNKLANGDYYRWIPDYKCKGKPTLLGSIHVSNDKVEAKILDPIDCQMSTVTLPEATLQALTISQLRTDALGFENTIYIKNDRVVDVLSPPNQAGEAWCQSGNLHIFVSYDARTREHHKIAGARVTRRV